jgi:hypothetical protein
VRDRYRRGEVEKSGRGIKFKAEIGVLASSGLEILCASEHTTEDSYCNFLQSRSEVALKRAVYVIARAETLLTAPIFQ